jgi:hypothetical protein
MPADVVPFPHKVPPVEPLAQFIRLGELAFQRVGGLFVEGHLHAKRVVIDASKIRHQREIIKAFKEAGAEIVLDTKAAELASVAKFAGLPRGAPWSQLANGDRLGPAVFMPTHSGDIYGQIARCALDYGVDVVLSPGHFIGDKHFGGWFEVDRAACGRLRDALDREGGRHIAIDYLLVLPHTQLNESEVRLKIAAGLSGLPFDNLWIRASGFGNDAGHLTVSRFTSALMSLHNIGKPIITDYLGGLIGEAVLALGAASGFAHGIGERERFNASAWERVPEKKEDDQGGGPAKRVLISAFNKSLSVGEFELLCSATGGKRLLVNQDRKICPKGMVDMTSDPRVVAAHDLVQFFEDLSGVPGNHRGDHFLRHRLEPAVRMSELVKNLTPSAEIAAQKNVDLEKFMTRLSDHSKKLRQQANTLSILNDNLKESGGRSRAIQRLAPLDQTSRGRVS